MRNKENIFIPAVLFLLFLFGSFPMIAISQYRTNDIINYNEAGINQGTSGQKTDSIPEQEKPSTKRTGLKRGYVGMVLAGYGFGVGSKSAGLNYIKVEVINGNQFNPYFSAGLGLSMKLCFFSGSNIKSLWFPLFLDFRTYILDKKRSPFFGLGIGYTFEITPVMKPLGWMVTPSFGASFKLNNRYSLKAAIGYELQMISEKSYGVNSLHLNFGFGF